MITEIRDEILSTLNGLNVFLVDLADGIGKPEHGFLSLGKKDESCLNYLPKCQEV